MARLTDEQIEELKSLDLESLDLDSVSTLGLIDVFR